MRSKDEVKHQIESAFSTVPVPPDWCLVGSNEGDEPARVRAAFVGIRDWRSLSAQELDLAPDGLGSALTFFSDEAFRYYLQAYLISDLEVGLNANDMIVHLTMGLTNKLRNEHVNPIRYGARTWADYYSYRYSVFTKEQVQAIVSYLEFKLQSGELADFECNEIHEALRNYWLPRLESYDPKFI